MKTNEAIQSIPRYVLLREDESPYGPRCREHDGQPCFAVYGFTTRAAYEAFCGGLTEPWRPYPLVSGYLTRRFDQPGLKLLVVDATGPDETSLNATAAEEALTAERDAGGPVATDYRLSFAPGASEYDVEPLSLCDAK